MTPNESEATIATVKSESEAPQPGLFAAEAAFCDSLEVLAAARRHGLRPEARILTMSPAVALAGIENVEFLESRLSTDIIRWTHGSLNDFGEAVVAAVSAVPAIKAHALVAGQTALGLNPLMLRAACLTEEDFLAPRAVLLVDESSHGFNSIFGAPWPDLLASSERLSVARFRASPTSERAIRGESESSFRSRLALAGPERIAYRALLRLWRLLPTSLGRGEVVIAKENELVNETALHLGLRGYALRALGTRPDPADPADDTTRCALRSVLEPVLRARLGQLLVPAAQDSVTEIFFGRLDAAVAEQRGWKKFWTAEFARGSGRRPAAILANFPTAEQFEPLRSIARDAGCLVAGFQHGVDREMAWAMDQYELALENVCSDLLIAYNEASRKTALRNRFAAACEEVAAVGMPKDYFRVGRPPVDWSAPPILFISTLLYRGYNQLRFEEDTDLQKARDEIALIENVLGRLPHRVAYKPYPAMRFPDPDPVMAAARDAASVAISGTHVDLRYMLGRHRVLVSTRATSTIGWCVMSGRPFAFIDTGDYFRIQPDMREAFVEGTFFFDATRSDWQEELRAFLSQPVDEIEKQWRAKAEGHRRLVERCFTLPSPGAGKRAARVIADRISGRAA